MTLIFRSPAEFEQEVILRFRDGWSVRRLTRHFGISRNTVRRILRAHHARRAAGHDMLPSKVSRASKLDAFTGKIQEELKKFPHITGVRLLEKLQDEGFTGGRTILREYLMKVRAPQQEPVIRFETLPGQQGQMDWSPYTLRFTRTGKAEVLCFSYILGFSRRQFIAFTLKRDFFTLIRRHQDAFDHYGGVPRECLYDNEKTVVLRWEAGRPVFNPAFTAFITHYDCRPVACRPGHPETKGKIEAPFRYVEGNLLGGREFQDLEDLRATARWWLAEKSDRHIHATTKRPPIELFLEQEQEALLPLPRAPYDSSEVTLALCDGEGYVRFQTNRYAVPMGHIGDLLSLKATENEILIYSPEIELLARHERQPAGRGLKIRGSIPDPVKKERYGLEPVKEAFLALGEAAGEFLAGLTNKVPRSVGFHARLILSLKEQYSSGDIHLALQHALRYGAFDAKAIERILGARAEPRTLESVRNERARQELEKALPKIVQTSLSDFGFLFQPQEETHGNETGNPNEDQGPPGNPEAGGDPTGS
jgi:transposase